MTTNYNGEHSILFGPLNGRSGVHTWNDWFLIPTSRPTMSLPGVSSRYVDIPGRNGGYDLSDYLTTGPIYTDRTGSFEFIVASDRTDWLTALRNVTTYLHGQRRNMILVDDRNWYYTGRFTVDSLKSDPASSKITISYRVAPFKISVDATYIDDTVWDPFNFITDIDWSVNSSITLHNERRTVSVAPSPATSNPLTVRFPESSYQNGDRVTASFGGVTKVLTFAGQEEILGACNPFTSSEFVLEGTGTVESGWRFVSL